MNLSPVLMQMFSGHGATEATFAAQIRILMVVVLGFSAATLAMQVQSYIYVYNIHL